MDSTKETQDVEQGGVQGSSQNGDQAAQGSLEGTAAGPAAQLHDTVPEGASVGDGVQVGGASAAASGHAGEGAGSASMQGTASMQGAAGGERRQAGVSSTGVLRPPVDVIEDAQGITLLADLPGVSKENLNLRLDAQSLTIEGAMSLDVPEQMESRYAEIRHQHYERTFALSRELDGEKAVAELANGVLRIRIPKTAHATPRKIPVNITSA